MVYRFTQAGSNGILHDKTRLSRVRPLGSNITERVVTLTQIEPPPEERTSAMMAKVVDISASSVQRIWHTLGIPLRRRCCSTCWRPREQDRPSECHDADEADGELYCRPRTTKPEPGYKIYPYLTRPNRIWAMDITYPMARG